MEEFSFEEIADIIFTYGQADGNRYEARRLYAEKYPNRRIPNVKTFQRMFERLRNRGCVTKHSQDAGRVRTRRTVIAEERILEEIESDPSISTRQLARMEDISYTSVWRTLNENNMYPYHWQRVQELIETDHPRRFSFCMDMKQNFEEDPSFSRRILFTDEATFTRNGIFNTRNAHTWAEENPHTILESNSQRQFSVNVWLGVVDEQLIGPYILPARLTGQIYVDFLKNILPGLLENVNLEVRKNMWFMQDGAPAHYCSQARQYLHEQFPNKWIGRGGPLEWPARLPDLNTLDFSLWGYLKNLMYKDPICDRDNLQFKIMQKSADITNNRELFKKIEKSFKKRIQLCINEGGGHFEHLLL